MGILLASIYPPDSDGYFRLSHRLEKQKMPKANCIGYKFRTRPYTRRVLRAMHRVHDMEPWAGNVDEFKLEGKACRCLQREDMHPMQRLQWRDGCPIHDPQAVLNRRRLELVEEVEELYEDSAFDSEDEPEDLCEGCGQSRTTYHVDCPLICDGADSTYCECPHHHGGDNRQSFAEMHLDWDALHSGYYTGDDDEDYIHESSESDHELDKNEKIVKAVREIKKTTEAALVDCALPTKITEIVGGYIAHVEL